MRFATNPAEASRVLLLRQTWMLGRPPLPKSFARKCQTKPQRHLVFGSEAFSYTPKFNQGTDASFKNPDFDAVNVHPLPDTHYGGRTLSDGQLHVEGTDALRISRLLPGHLRERKPMIMDEDNCASLYRDEVGWTIHRKRAWTALLSGSHYDYIDFSINVGLKPEPKLPEPRSAPG